MGIDILSERSGLPWARTITTITRKMPAVQLKGVTTDPPEDKYIAPRP